MGLVTCQKCGATIGARLQTCPYCVPEDGDLESHGAPAADAGDIASGRAPWQFLSGVIVAVLALSAFLLRPTSDLPQDPPVAATSAIDARELIQPEPESRQSVTASETVLEPEPEALPDGRPENEQSALQDAAESGDLEAQVELGFAAYPSATSPRDFRESLRWFRAAAEGGHPVAQKQLGWMHFEGEGVLRDEERALQWYRLAAEQGDVEAQRAVEILAKPSFEAARMETEESAGLTDSSARSTQPDRGEEAVISSETESNELQPLVVIHEHNQYFAYEPPAEPERQVVNYLAAAGFFARARQDAASRDFRQRARSRARPSRSRSSSSPGILGGSLSQAVTPMTKGPTPFTRGVTPLGGWRAVTNRSFGATARGR